MIPYADLLFFGLSLYVLIPTVALGVAGRLGWKWVAAATLLMSAAQLFLSSLGDARMRVWHLASVVGFLLWQWLVAASFLRWRKAGRSADVWLAVVGCLLPLLIVKLAPGLGVRGVIAFLGISYVSFRALDVVLAVHDGLAQDVPFAKYFTYLFFFPTLSSGPIDRWRRFLGDLEEKTTRAEYLTLLDSAVAAFFQGLLYKFIIAVVVEKYWLTPVSTQPGVLSTVSYMYAYSAYLFFDFAGYSALAISFSRALGVRTPPNFNQPFLAANIADFWARWHMSLSTFLRDHVYMRFLLANAKSRRIGSRETASAIALVLTFGLMGVWHGTEAHYVAYGLYHAVLMIVYDWWHRRVPLRDRKTPSPARRVAGILLTVQAVCFGFLVFSGKLF